MQQNKQSKPIIVNGKKFDSLRDASECLEISKEIIKKHYNTLMKSSFSNLDISIRRSVNYNFKKVKKEKE